MLPPWKYRLPPRLFLSRLISPRPQIPPLYHPFVLLPQISLPKMFHPRSFHLWTRLPWRFLPQRILPRVFSLPLLLLRFLLLLFLPWTIHPWKRRLLPRQSLQEPRPVRRLYPARTLLWLRQPSGTEPVSKIYSSFRSLFVMRQGRSPASAACIYLLKDFFEALPAHPLSDVSRHRPPGQDPVSGFPWTAASDTGPPCRPPGTSF